MTGPNGEVVDVLRYTDKIGYDCVAAGGPRASHDPIRARLAAGRASEATFLSTRYDTCPSPTAKSR